MVGEDVIFKRFGLCYLQSLNQPGSLFIWIFTRVLLSPQMTVHELPPVVPPQDAHLGLVAVPLPQEGWPKEIASKPQVLLAPNSQMRAFQDDERAEAIIH